MPGKDIPEIVWKAFIDSDHIAHVGPSLDGKMMAGHRLNRDCDCSPTEDRTRYTLIIIHHVIH